MAKEQVDNGGDDQDIDNDLFPSAEDLNEAEAIWGGGQEEADKQRPVGSMQALIEEATLGRSSSSDRLQIHYTLKVLTGAGKDEVLHKYDGLGTAQQASITQNQLRRLGVDTKKVGLKQLPAHLMDLQGKKIIINCKQNGDFYNIYFTKLVTDTPTSGPRPGGSAGGKPSGGGKPTPSGAAGAKKKF